MSSEGATGSGRPAAPALRRTPLYEAHVAAGAKLVDFAGWEMPVQYTGVIDEHRAVRTRAGLFDVSHMGEFTISGPGALDFVQGLTPNDVAKLVPGRIHYSALLTREGTFIDDVLVYRLGEQEFMLVVNAANIAPDFAWISSLPRPAGVVLEDRSDRFALLALQGPRALAILQPLTASALSPIKYYGFVHGEVASKPALISRTGYTGEDGFELYVAPQDALEIWRALMKAGEAEGLVPAGLGARDTLRLEAGMALYGHEIDRTTTPWDARLDWIVKLEKGDFIGRQALLDARTRGASRQLVGFEVESRGIARQGCGIVAGGEAVGTVTSGTWSPTFEKAIGMAYVPAASAEAGTEIEIDVRGKPVMARTRLLPFYKRSR
ncbi:MAG: glycine cleavage system aminomethyltransferase GcvT [Thermoanaerobaculia bacterium]